MSDTKALAAAFQQLHLHGVRRFVRTPTLASGRTDKTRTDNTRTMFYKAVFYKAAGYSAQSGQNLVNSVRVWRKKARAARKG